MKTIAVAEFKAKCLGILEDMRRKRDPVIIKKRGVVIAQILPVTHAPKSDRDILAGAIVEERDIVSPLNETWSAIK